MKRFKPETGRWWIAENIDVSVVGYLDVATKTRGPWRLTVEGGLPELTPRGFDTHQTIHGRTPSGDYTLFRAGVSLTRHGNLDAQQWRGWELVKGGHAEPDQRFAYASFRLPKLWHWLGPSSLNYHTTERFTADKDRADNPVLTAQLEDGLQLDLYAAFSERVGRSHQSWTGYGVYDLHGPAGLTLNDLERVTLALSRLHAIVTASPMEAFNVRLMTELEDPRSMLDVVDPHPRRVRNGERDSCRTRSSTRARSTSRRSSPSGYACTTGPSQQSPWQPHGTIDRS